MAQSDAAYMVRATCASTAASSGEPSPRRMPSRSDEAVASPARQGVHFPHESDKNRRTSEAVKSTGHCSGGSEVSRRAVNSAMASCCRRAASGASTTKRDIGLPLRRSRKTQRRRPLSGTSAPRQNRVKVTTDATGPLSPIGQRRPRVPATRRRGPSILPSSVIAKAMGLVEQPTFAVASVLCTLLLFLLICLLARKQLAAELRKLFSA